MSEVVLVAGLAATWAMVGIVWFVQVVHYPMLRHAAGPAFPGVAAEHARRTGRLVAPLMAAEALSALVLLIVRPDGVPLWAAMLAAALLVGVWAMTALVQVPHRDHARHRRVDLRLLELNPQLAEFRLGLFALRRGELKLRLDHRDARLLLVELLLGKQLLLKKLLRALEIRLDVGQFRFPLGDVRGADLNRRFGSAHALLDLVVVQRGDQLPRFHPVAYLKQHPVQPALRSRHHRNRLLGLERAGQQQLFANLSAANLGEVHADRPSPALLLFRRRGLLLLNLVHARSDEEDETASDDDRQQALYPGRHFGFFSVGPDAPDPYGGGVPSKALVTPPAAPLRVQATLFKPLRAATL